MAGTGGSATASTDSLASLERLKRVETEGELRLRTARGKIEQILSHLRDESEAQIQAAREQAEKDAAAALERARSEADAEAARILSAAKTALDQRARAGATDLTTVWEALLDVLFDEFH